MNPCRARERLGTWETQAGQFGLYPQTARDSRLEGTSLDHHVQTARQLDSDDLGEVSRAEEHALERRIQVTQTPVREERIIEHTSSITGTETSSHAALHATLSMSVHRRSTGRRRCHDGCVIHEGMPLEQMLAVLDTVGSLGCQFWIEGGWGVDALVGRQTRPHRDVDIDIDGTFEEEVLMALVQMGYAIESDWRPNRVELGAPDRGWVDVHPLVLDEEGNARQAALGGGWHEFPRSFFTVGRLGDMSVPCCSIEAQRLFHSGYELREADQHDLAVLEQLETQ
jgi:lincosamide nucleotidyltransferase A/C/D/E